MNFRVITTIEHVRAAFTLLLCGSLSKCTRTLDAITKDIQTANQDIRWIVTAGLTPTSKVASNPTTGNTLNWLPCGLGKVGSQLLILVFLLLSQQFSH